MVILSYTIKISKENVPTNALKIFKKRSFYRDLWRADVFYLVTCKGSNRVTVLKKSYRAQRRIAVTVNSLTHLHFLVPITFNPIRFVWKWLELPTCAGAFPKLGNKFQVQIGFTLNQIVAGRLTERMNHTGDPKKETLLFNQKIRPHILK